MHVGFFILLFLTEGVSSQKVCSHQDVVDYLDLTKKKEVYTSTRPVLDYTHTTVVHLDVYLCAILAVNEKTQSFIPLIWIQMMWNDERVSWDPSQFCGITQISLPNEMLWKPDLFIYEMTQKDDALPSPYLHMTHKGIVSSEGDLKVVSTCRINVHKFPFDTQSCNITFSSVTHTVNTSFQITMKRRPLRHVISFLLPILFFLCLDLASFFISDDRGEKLGFKVTVLLAISVLLLILNDILPSMCNKTPLIATYCIVIFALMLLSLLETVLVTYLMGKDALPQENEADRDKGTQDKAKCQNFERGEEKKQTCCACICDVSGGDTPCLLPVAEQVINRPQRSHLLLLILEELREMETLDLFLSSRKEGGTSGHWTRVASRLNTAFFICYVITVSVFLILMYIEWRT
ncbi:5-hydroxytryptamine receptor 3A-like [Polymixia lowei]